MVYLALYKGKADNRLYRFYDAITRLFTRGLYSHCEIAIEDSDGLYSCYSSSIRDGGVRVKRMVLDTNKWDLVPIKLKRHNVHQYFLETKGSGYDLLGALGVVSGLRQNRHKYFCSEWCYECITGTNEGWRFSPTLLHRVIVDLH